MIDIRDIEFLNNIPEEIIRLKKENEIARSDNEYLKGKIGLLKILSWSLGFSFSCVLIYCLISKNSDDSVLPALTTNLGNDTPLSQTENNSNG